MFLSQSIAFNITDAFAGMPFGEVELPQAMQYLYKFEVVEELVPVEEDFARSGDHVSDLRV